MAAVLESSKKDLIAGAGLLAIAASLRFWNITHLGLTHFDEGTYTLAAKWLGTFGREGALYNPVLAPGLFPALAGTFFLAFGVQDYVAIAVSAVAGSLTVVLLYFIGRDWFTRRVGALAALFLATAEYHLVLSRQALTDATFTLLFWAALACLFKGLTQQNRWWTVAGGVATGLCWNTKYNGFFPLVIAGLWLGVDATLRSREGAREALRAVPLRRFALAAAIAATLYLPWALVVQRAVGYDALLRVHSQHSVGSGALLVTSPAALLFYFRQWLSPPLLVFASIGFLAALLDRKRASTLLVTASVFFTLSAMFYMSFPRLVLPVVPAICLFAARGLDLLGAKAPNRSALLVGAGGLLVLAWNGVGVAKVLALRTDAYRRAAEYLHQSSLPVVTQMSKNFYFYDDGTFLEMRFQDPAALDAVVRGAPEVLLAVDPIIARLPQAEAWFEAARGGRIPERVFPIEMYEPVYFQGFDPNIPFEKIPRSFAPFVPGKSEIVVFRLQKPE